MRSAATVTSISAPSIVFPKKTSSAGAHWATEASARTASEPGFGQTEITAYELATYVDVSTSLVEDAAVDLGAVITQDLAEKFAATEGQAFVTGDGNNKPEGILTHADVGSVANGHASNLQVDGLLSLFHSLPAQYRNRGAWMMNAATIGAVRKLKDTNGDYLWRESISEANPATILGRPVVEAVDMPDIAAGETPIIFGDFASAYRIVQRVGLQVLRDPYSVAAQGLVRFHARSRVGGRVVLGEAVKKLSMEV